jgi:predicted GTPase
VDIITGYDINLRVVVIRHPMPYGKLAAQAVERFASQSDLDKFNCTIEEREEYLPHIERDTVVYAGVDYERILREAEKEADVIIWDGGNNDFSFIKPDLTVTVADCMRPGHELAFYPGETNFRMADVIILNKISTARPEDAELITRNARAVNPGAVLVHGDLKIEADRLEEIRGKRVLVIEDGPTITHGGLGFGAGTIIAQKAGAYTVNPRQSAVGSIKGVYEKYPHIGAVLPAMGYSPEQVKELEETINATSCDAVIIGTPVDLRHLISINKPTIRVTYSFREIGKPDLTEPIMKILKKLK